MSTLPAPRPVFLVFEADDTDFETATLQGVYATEEAACRRMDEITCHFGPDITDWEWIGNFETADPAEIVSSRGGDGTKLVTDSLWIVSSRGDATDIEAALWIEAWVPA